MNQHIQKQIEEFKKKFPQTNGDLMNVYPMWKIESFLQTVLSTVWEEAEKETAKKFDNFKVVEYSGDPKDFPTSDFAWKAGQMYVMIKIKQLIDSLKQTT